MSRHRPMHGLWPRPVHKFAAGLVYGYAHFSRGLADAPHASCDALSLLEASEPGA